MGSREEEQFHYCLWEKGSLRLFYATWTAMTMSYGLNADEITVWAEYFSLLSRCFVNLAVAMGEPIYVYDAYNDENLPPYNNP